MHGIRMLIVQYMGQRMHGVWLLLVGAGAWRISSGWLFSVGADQPIMMHGIRLLLVQYMWERMHGIWLLLVGTEASGQTAYRGGCCKAREAASWRATCTRGWFAVVFNLKGVEVNVVGECVPETRVFGQQVRLK
jgi:hypothetical protein